MLHCCLCLAWFYGDPHFQTIDGNTYTFNGHGEYILLRLISGSFEIQCRTSRFERSDGSDSDATVFSAFAVKGIDTWVQVKVTCSTLRLLCKVRLFYKDWNWSYSNFRPAGTERCIYCWENPEKTAGLTWWPNTISRADEGRTQAALVRGLGNNHRNIQTS